MLGRPANTSTSDSTDSAASVRRKLGDLLVEARLITPAQLEEARKMQRESGGFMGQILVQLRYVSQEDISTCLVKHCKIPHLSLMDYDIGSKVLSLVPEDICQKYGLIPIDKLGRILTVAMVDPLDSEALDAVRQCCPDLRIKPILCNWAHFEMVARKSFKQTASASSGEMSMESLGLGNIPAAPAPILEVVPVAQEEADPPPALDTSALAAALASSLQDALQPVRELAQALQQRGTAAPGTSGENLGDAIREGVRQALQESGKGAPVDNGLGEMLREMMESNQALQAVQQARMSEIAEAVLQGVQGGLLKGKDGGASTPGGHVTAFVNHGTEDSPSSEREEADARVVESLRTGGPLEELTFENFLPGEANELAFKVSQEVAQSPGGEYNPFFLHGKVGVGKTHLITAVGNSIRVNKPGLRVGYISASYFARGVADAMRDQSMDVFREAHCRWDVLILDDIQFLGGRVEAQEEFFHIFNVLHQERRQIIIASDKAPERLGLLEKRLISRFASGMVAELKAPEWRTRIEILRERIRQTGVEVPEEIVSLIATRVPDDVRRMTGALKRMCAHAKLVKTELTCELATEVLRDIQAEEAA